MKKNYHETAVKGQIYINELKQKSFNICFLISCSFWLECRGEFKRLLQMDIRDVLKDRFCYNLVLVLSYERYEDVKLFLNGPWWLGYEV